MLTDQSRGRGGGAHEHRGAARRGAQPGARAAGRHAGRGRPRRRCNGARRSNGRRRGQGEGGDRAGRSASVAGRADAARNLLGPRDRGRSGPHVPVLAGLASRWLLLTLVDAGDWTAVEQLATALLVRGDEAGDLHTAATAHHSMGVMARELGDLAEADKSAETALALTDRGSCAPRRESDDGPQPRDERV